MARSRLVPARTSARTAHDKHGAVACRWSNSTRSYWRLAARPGGYLGYVRSSRSASGFIPSTGLSGKRIPAPALFVGDAGDDDMALARAGVTWETPLQAPPANPWALAAALIDPVDQLRYLSHPEDWVRDKLGDTLWSRQREIMEAVRDYRHVAVHSCHESGKSWTASRVVCWWLDSHPAGTAFAVTTAPSSSQVRAILWREINKAHMKAENRGAPLLGRTNQTEWWIGKEMIAMGRKPRDYSSEAFQGIHQRYVLVVIDEANGVPSDLWDAAETLVANESGRILAIGNPDDPSSSFAEACKPGSGWNTIHIGYKDTPNFTGEYVPKAVAEQLIGPTWVEERRAKWGENSPLFVSKVEGNFPESVADGVVPWSWVLACQQEEGPHVWLPDPKRDLNVLGVDVGAGGDKTVIWHRRGNRAMESWEDHSNDPEVVTGAIMRRIRERRATVVNIDIIGIGWGVAGLLRREIEQAHLDWPCAVYGVNVATEAKDKAHFLNLRAELWWDVGRENSRLHRWDLRNVPDDTVAQLIASKYQTARSGLIQIEKKDDVRQRIGRSPDDADALLLCFYEPPRREHQSVQPVSLTRLGGSTWRNVGVAR